MLTSRLWRDQLKCLDERARLDGNVTRSGDVETLKRQGKPQLLTTHRVSWNFALSEREFLSMRKVGSAGLRKPASP